MDNHLVLQVHGLPCDQNPEGKWYVDAGLGDALYEPLPLVEGTHRQGPFEFELSVSDWPHAQWRLRHHPLGSFSGMAFRAAPAAIGDFAKRNEFLSTSPESTFAKIVTAQRRDATGVDILRGQVLSRVESNIGEGRTIESRHEWFQALADVFDLPLAHVADEQLDVLWNRVHTTHEAWQATQQ